MEKNSLNQQHSHWQSAQRRGAEVENIRSCGAGKISTAQPPNLFLFSFFVPGEPHGSKYSKVMEYYNKILKRICSLPLPLPYLFGTILFHWVCSGKSGF